jgi:hypothetical protein
VIYMLKSRGEGKAREEAAINGSREKRRRFDRFRSYFGKHRALDQTNGTREGWVSGLGH